MSPVPGQPVWSGWSQEKQQLPSSSQHLEAEGLSQRQIPVRVKPRLLSHHHYGLLQVLSPLPLAWHLLPHLPHYHTFPCSILGTLFHKVGIIIARLNEKSLSWLLR